ncbi:MAG TPA: hypothetical protein VKE98_12765 [Gemmataceae bacterium]|nr:hypothetical protein [Gemmataceae bacterium]
MSARKDRRAFHKTIGLLAAGSLAVPALEAGAVQPSGEGDSRKVAAGALMDIIRSRYGKFLSEEQLKRVRQKILGNLSMAESLRRVPLQNSNEPALVFRADLP